MYVSGSSSTYDISFYLQQKVKNSSGSNNSNQTEIADKVQSDKEVSKYSKNVNETESNSDIYNNTGRVSEKSSNVDGLTEEETQTVKALKLRDLEVRSHEQAHQVAAGSLARGSVQFKYETGPDNKQYAVGGSVDIDTSKGRTPEETIAKAQIIKNAALAPQNPSGQDQKVAQEASQMEAEARAENASNKFQGFQAYGIQESENTKKSNTISSINNTIKMQINDDSKDEKEEIAMSASSPSKLDIEQNQNYSPINFFA